MSTGAVATEPLSTHPVGSPNAEKHDALARVLRSGTFAKASRLCALLSYIVEHSIEGRRSELAEQQIGIHVFGRDAGFNSSEDTIVRGTARLLRLRLDLYYREEGRLDPLRIAIPKGGYVAQFEPAQPPVEPQRIPTVEAAAPETPPLPVIQRSWPLSAKLAVTIVTLCATVLSGLLIQRSRPASRVWAGPLPLWNAMFTPGRKTLIVPGDGSLDAFITWEKRPVSLADYSNQTYLREAHTSLPPAGNDVPLAARSVTPMADLRLVSELVRVPGRIARPDLEPWIEIRYARDVAVGDTHDNNLILIGSETFNPWVTLYKGSMDLYAKHDFNDDIYSIVNLKPRAGEQTQYNYARSESTPSMLAYTHIAFLDNAQGNGNVLIIEGTSMGTTYAALTFFTQDQLWQPVLSAATDRSGKLHSFEVLLGSEFVRGGLTNTRRVAFHVH